VEVKDAGEHARLLGIELPRGLRLGDDPLELLGGPTLGLGVGVRPSSRRIQCDAAVSTTTNGLKRTRKNASGLLIRRATPSACWIANSFGTSSPTVMWALVMIR